MATSAPPAMTTAVAATALMAAAVDRLAPSALATFSAVAATAILAPALLRVYRMAAPATTTMTAATLQFAQAEDVAGRNTTSAAPTLSAVPATAACPPAGALAFAACDCFPNGFPCTRSAHSAL